IGAFQRAWQAGRLAHAYLFVGPEGVGKRQFAEELARAILCEGRPADRLEACDECPSCHLLDGQAHPDYLAIARPDDKTTIPIDSMRDFCRKLALKPARGPRKVALVLDADDLTDPTVPAAAN